MGFHRNFLQKYQDGWDNRQAQAYDRYNNQKNFHNNRYYSLSNLTESEGPVRVADICTQTDPLLAQV